MLFSLALGELLVRTLQIRAAVTNGFIKVVTLIEEAMHSWNCKKGTISKYLKYLKRAFDVMCP